MTPFEKALLLPPEVLYLGLGFSVAAVLLALFLRHERTHVSRVGLLYGLSLALRLATAIFAGLAMPKTVNTLEFLAVLFQGVAFLNLAAVLLFSVGVSVLRFESPRILRDLTVAISYIVLLLYLFSTRHVDVAGIVATSAVITAVIGWSLQDTLANFMGGVALQLDGSVTPGDWVKFGDVSGIVREISWRHTAIETRNGDTVIIPNSALMKNPVMRQGRRLEGGPLQERRWVYFHVDYRYAPNLVIDAVTEALRREPIPNVSSTPQPDVILTEFRDSWAVYAARYWLTDIFLDDPTDSVVRTRVFYALRRSGIPLSIPAETIFLEAENDVRRQRKTERERQARLRVLESVSLFSSLTAEERALLAGALIHAPFSAGEALVVQGKAVHHLYVLTKGSVEVRVSVEGAPPRAIARLSAPDFFGEMGLLTGEPRRATVVALTEVECWRLEKEILRKVLEARPVIASEISHVLAERGVDLAAAREGLSEEARRRRLADEHDSFLGRIQRFFGIE